MVKDCSNLRKLFFMELCDLWQPSFLSTHKLFGFGHLTLRRVEKQTQLRNGWLADTSTGHLAKERVEKNEWRGQERQGKDESRARTIHSDTSTNDRPMNRFKKVKI
jgi:hypothetical protein